MLNFCEAKQSTKTIASSSVAAVLCLSLTLIIAVLAPSQLHGQSIQRLFTSPTTRAELDRLRFQIASGAIVTEEIVEETSVELPDFSDEEVEVIYAVGGSMRKADGSYTVWINNVAYDQTSLSANMELLSPFSQGQILVSDPQTGTSFTVKPGQVLNLSAGRLYESYQYQSVVAAAAEAARIAEAEASAFELDAESELLSEDDAAQEL